MATSPEVAVEEPPARGILKHEKEARPGSPCLSRLTSSSPTTDAKVELCVAGEFCEQVKPGLAAARNGPSRIPFPSQAMTTLGSGSQACVHFLSLLLLIYDLHLTEVWPHLRLQPGQLKLLLLNLADCPSRSVGSILIGCRCPAVVTHLAATDRNCSL